MFDHNRQSLKSLGTRAMRKKERRKSFVTPTVFPSFSKGIISIIQSLATNDGLLTSKINILVMDYEHTQLPKREKEEHTMSMFQEDDTLLLKRLSVCCFGYPTQGIPLST